MDISGTLALAQDEAAIRAALARYCRGIDRGDPVLIASAYWPEAEDHHGVFDGNAHEFARWIVPHLAKEYTLTQHLLGQSLIQMSGPDAAAVETYFSSRHGHARNGVRMVEMVSGRYIDRFARRAGEWRIADRLLIVDFVFDVPHPKSIVEDIPGSIFGCRGQEDASYGLFTAQQG
ncbi:hypothetical protein FHS51_004122 [Sphingobium wenxiniae]|uniref:SnoaL-like domain-containing protein n=2 Tax=Sphingobium TaxID=165695 RepID=T0HII8_9SPHN|nr:MULTISPECIES: nuclear transport factor 2 family protein [Sphingobium]EQA99184.1 hypothetical protein L485_16685 [Sphingobium baderi LL03]KMS61381.1 hypothetical protein V475_13750 [Sphingobium baderi LL03]MBB6193863.1 hypothetical protein [Sphingobium wenxiniae]TWH93642.1 SnoaL-like protein [Sphingobium wenxiniae]WRD75331.1 nuclear transport factor 2 family protein [Sphingobium baderi]